MKGVTNEVSKNMRLGTILSYINVFLNIAVSVVLSPFIVDSLGTAQYGLYQLIWSFVGYMGIFDLGFTNAVVRYVSKYRAENDEEGSKKFLGMALVVYGLIALVIITVGAVIYFNLGTIFAGSFKEGELPLAKILFIIMIINFVSNIFLNIFPAVINAYEKYTFQRGLQIARMVIRTAVVVAALLMGGKSISIAVIDTVMAILFFGTQMLYVLFVLKVKFSFKDMDFSFFKQIFTYSFFVFLGIIVDQVNWKLDILIIGMKMSTVNVAIYSIAIQFPSYYMMFANSFSNVFLPRTTAMCARNASNAEFTDLMIYTARIQWAVLFIMLIGFAVFGKEFIMLWQGEEFVEGYYIAVIIMTALTLPLFQSVGLSIQQAKNKHRFLAVTYFICAILNVIATAVSVNYFGMMGAAVSTALAFVLGHCVTGNLYYRFGIGLEIKRFFAEITKGMLPATLIMLAIGYAVSLIPIGGWFGFIAKAAMFGIIYVPVFLFIGFNRRERAELPIVGRFFGGNGD